MKRNQLIVVGVVLVMIVAIGGYVSMQGGGGEGEEGAPDFIDVGLIAPTTGTYAKNGERLVEATKWTTEKINTDGGVYVKKYDQKIPLKLHIKDSESKIEPTVSAARGLVEKVDIITGGYWSTAAEAWVPICEKAGMPTMLSCPWTISVVENSDWVVKTSPSPPTRGTSMAEAVVALTDPDKLGLMIEDSATARNSWKYFEPRLKELKPDIEIVNPGYLSPGATNFKSTLRQLKSADVDTVWNMQLGAKCYTVTRQLQEVQLNKGQYFATWGDMFTTQDWLNSLGEKAVGIINNEMWSPKINDLAMKFAEEWRADHGGSDPSYYTAEAYDGTRFIAAVIEEAGSLEPKAIRDAFFEAEIDGVWAPHISFTPDQRYIKHPRVFDQIQMVGGEPKRVIVYPESAKEGELKDPPWW